MLAETLASSRYSDMQLRSYSGAGRPQHLQIDVRLSTPSSFFRHCPLKRNMKMKSLTLLVGGCLAVQATIASTLAAQKPIAIDAELSTDFHSIVNPTSAASLKSLFSLHKSLVEHESISGNELAVGNFLISYLESQNLTVEKQIVSTDPERFNIYAYLGEARSTKVLVSSHIDTVPPFWKYEHRSDDTIWGRGSVDAKGSVVCQVKAFEALAAEGTISEGDVALLFVVGEEVGGDGMEKANELNLSWDAAIFGEPTELKLASGHKGNVGFKLIAKGKAGHSGYPELGRSANLMLIDALHHLSKAEFPSSKKYGNTTINFGRIEGGVAANVIAEDALANIAMRIADGEPEEVMDIVKKAVAKAGYAEEDLYIQRGVRGYGPVPIDHDVPGFDEIVVNYGTDIPRLRGDHKRYLYGPGDILVAHSDHEHLKLSDLETAVKGYKKLIKATLKM